MALLEILKFPDPRLRIKAKPVTQFDDDLKRLVNDMYDTMYAHNGVGLQVRKSTYINISLRWMFLRIAIHLCV